MDRGGGRIRDSAGLVVHERELAKGVALLVDLDRLVACQVV